MPKDKILLWIITVILIALIIRILLFLAILQRNPNGFFDTDSYDYWNIAENILNYGSFSSNANQPLISNHSRTPLYPLFISLLKWARLNVAGIIFIQIILSSLNCFFVILLSYKLAGNWQSASIAGGIVATDIPSIVLANSLLTETLFVFLMTLSILYLIIYLKQQKKIITLVISGALMGLSVLCRPIGFFLPFFLTPFFVAFSQLTRKQLLRNVFIYYISCLFIISPWLVRNQVVFNSPFLSTISYHNLLYYRAAGVYAVKEGISLSKSQEFLKEKVNDEFNGNPEKEPIKYKKFEAKMGMLIILKNLNIYIKNHIISVLNMLFNPIRSSIDLQLGFSKEGTSLTGWEKENNSPILSKLLQKTSMLTIILVFIQLFILIILWISFVYGIIACFKEKKYLVFGIVIVAIIYFCIMSGGPEAYARFRVPIVPFLAIGSAVGIINLYRFKIHKFGRI